MKQKTRDQLEKNLREGFRKFGSEYAGEDETPGYLSEYASDYLANTAGSMIYNTHPFEARDSDEAQNLADVLETDDHESGAAGSTRPTSPAASAGYGTRRRKEK